MAMTEAEEQSNISLSKAQSSACAWTVILHQADLGAR